MLVAVSNRARLQEITARRRVSKGAACGEGMVYCSLRGIYDNEGLESRTKLYEQRK